MMNVCEDNFSEMLWAICELKNTYILLRAYSDKKSALTPNFSPESFKCCETLLCDMAEQYSNLFLENARLIIGKLT